MLGLCDSLCARAGESASSPINKCSGTITPNSWSSEEAWIWGQICAGQVADLDQYTAESGQSPTPAGSPKSRHFVSAIFLRTILYEDSYRSAVPRQGLRIRGATFREPVNLDGAQAMWDVWLDACTFAKGLSLRGLDASEALTLDGSEVSEGLDLSDAHIARYLGLRGASFDAIRLTGAVIGEDVFIDNSVGGLPATVVRGYLNMNAIHIGRRLSLAGSSLHDVGLLGARIQGSMNASHVKLGNLNMDSAWVGQHLRMDYGRVDFVDLSGMRVAGTLELDHTTVAHKLTMESTSIGQTANLQAIRANDVVLAHADSGGNIDLAGSLIHDLLDVDALTVSADLILERAVIGSMRGTSAQIGGDVDLDDLTARGDIGMNSASIGGHFFLGSATLKNVDFHVARVEGAFDLRPDGRSEKANALKATKIDGLLNMDGAQIGQDLVLSGAFLTRVTLNGAKVAGSVSGQPYKPLNGTKSLTTSSSEMLSMDRLQVGGLVNLNETSLHNVSLTGARLDGDLYLDNATVTGRLEMERAHVAGSLFFRHGRNTPGLTSGRRWVPADFSFCTVGGSLDVSDTEFDAVDFTGAQVGQTLRIGTHSWKPDSYLSLRNVSTQAIYDTCTKDGLDCLDMWPRELDIEGFSYSHPGEFQDSSGTEMTARVGAWWIAWLERERAFSPEPYEHVAANLRSLGIVDASEQVQYAEKKHEMMESLRSLAIALKSLRLDATLNSLTRALWLTALWAAIGFGIGYHLLFNTLAWVALWVFLGVMVMRHYHETTSNGLPTWPIAYSFDMLLPVARLREEHYKIDLKSRARIYFYFHKIMGFLLASFLVAGLSGLVEK
jgi:uncharacterized protein YjbI with pentapeptide repeats